MENSKRETKELVTVGGHKVVVYTFATGREKRAVMDVFLSKTDVGMVGKEITADIKGSLVSKMEDVALQQFVVSVDGQTENVVDLVLNLPAEDSDEVLAFVDTLTNTKKKSNG